MRKRIFLILGIVVIGLVAWGFYWYKKPRTDISGVAAIASLDAKSLYAAFQANETLATKKFADKIVEVTRIVEDVQKTDSTLTIQLAADTGGGINCNLPAAGKATALPVKGAPLTVKGRCTGYLMDVNLVDCIIMKNKTGQ